MRIEFKSRKAISLPAGHKIRHNDEELDEEWAKTLGGDEVEHNDDEDIAKLLLEYGKPSL